MFGCSSKTATAVLKALVRDGKAFAIKKTSKGLIYGASKPVPVTQQIVDAMGDKAWFAKDLAEVLEMNREVVAKHLSALQVRKRVVRERLKEQFWVWRVVAADPDDFVPEADPHLKSLMQQAWRGTPWQGMEAVL